MGEQGSLRTPSRLARAVVVLATSDAAGGALRAALAGIVDDVEVVADLSALTHSPACLVAEAAAIVPDVAAALVRMTDAPGQEAIALIVVGAAGDDNPALPSTALLVQDPSHADALRRAVRWVLAAQARERRLSDSEARFRDIAESIDQMVWSAGPDGVQDYCNARWHEFTGLSAGAVTGLDWAEIVHADDRAQAQADWAASLATGEPCRLEYRLRHHTGRYRWILGRAHPVRDANGTVTRWHGTSTDIQQEVEDREWLEAAVRDRTQDLANLYARTPVALHSLDGGRRIVDVSDRWLELLGYAARGEVIGRPIADFIDAAEMPRCSDGLDAMVNEGTVVKHDIPSVLRHRDGHAIDVSVSVRITFDTDGRMTRLMAALVDVTERKSAEAARDRAEIALRQSQKLETIGQLTGGVAHDFNNLLMAIRSSLDLLSRILPEHDGRAERYLANAVKATERGAGLTQRMLAFARRQDLRADAVDVAALLSGLSDLLARSVGPQVEIAVAVAPDVPAALVDANQLEMALLNLAVNGRDAMDGIGTLTLSVGETGACHDLAPGRYVRITVEDTGAGMDSGTLALATEPFFTTKGVGRGTGLGLPMVHGLAKQSGGTFQLESEPGVGTRAEIYLPVADVAAAPAPNPAAGFRPAAASSRAARLTILAVDDDMLVLMGTVGLLEDMGHEVLEAGSGHDALEVLADREDLDLVITDQAMPKMTGTQLAATIRAVRPGLPVILATGYAEIPDGAEDLIAARLEKPFAESALAAVIARVMGPA